MKPKQIGEILSEQIAIPDERRLYPPKHFEEINTLGQQLESLFDRIHNLPQSVKDYLQERNEGLTAETERVVLLEEDDYMEEGQHIFYAEIGRFAYFEIPVPRKILKRTLGKKAVKACRGLYESIDVGYVKKTWTGENGEPVRPPEFSVETATTLEAPRGVRYKKDAGELEEAIEKFYVVERTEKCLSVLDRLAESDCTQTVLKKEPFDDDELLARLLADRRIDEQDYKEILDSFDIKKLEAVVERLENLEQQLLAQD